MSGNKLQCRLCTSEQALLSMFSGINRKSRDYLRKMIMDVVHVKLDPDDAYSKCVCLKCAVHICNFFKFSQTCRDTDQKLRNSSSASGNSTKCSGTKVCDIKADGVEELILIVEEFLDKKTFENCNTNKFKKKLPNAVPKQTSSDSKCTQTIELSGLTKEACKCYERLINRTDSQTQTYIDLKNRCLQTENRGKDEAIQVDIVQKSAKRKSKNRYSQTQSSVLKDTEIQTDFLPTNLGNSTDSPVTSIVTINCENLFKPSRNSFDSLSPCSSDRLSNIVPDTLIEKINNDVNNSQSDITRESQNEEKSQENKLCTSDNNQNCKSKIAESTTHKIEVISNVTVSNIEESKLKTNNITNNLNTEDGPQSKKRRSVNKKTPNSTDKQTNKQNDKAVVENEIHRRQSSRTTKIINSVIENDQLSSHFKYIKNDQVSDSSEKLANKNDSCAEITKLNGAISNSLPLEKPNRNKKSSNKLLIEVKPKNILPKQKSVEKPPNDPRANVKKVLNFDSILTKNKISKEPTKNDSIDDNNPNESTKTNNLSSNSVYDFQTDDELAPEIEKSYKSDKLNIKNIGHESENIVNINSSKNDKIENNEVSLPLNNNLENPDKETSSLNHVTDINLKDSNATNEKNVNGTPIAETSIECDTKELPSNSKSPKRKSRGHKRKINVGSLTKCKNKRIKLTNQNDTSLVIDTLNTSIHESSSENIATPEKVDLKIQEDSANLEPKQCDSQTNSIPSKTPLLSPSLTDLLTVKKCQYQHVCRTCNNTFNSYLELRRHQRIHMRCPICNIKFRSIGQTRKHQETCKMSNVRAQVKLIRLEKNIQVLENYPDVKEYLCTNGNC